MTLNPNLILEAAYDNKELKGLEDEWYAKLIFIYPGRQGPTALDGKSSSMWKEEKDMSGQMLTKVKRQNKISTKNNIQICVAIALTSCWKNDVHV